MVFSKSYCPYCKRAKDLLSKVFPNYTAIELDQLPDGSEIQAALLELSGQRTVPNIYIKGKHLGGCDDLLKAHSSGKLEQLLA
ncbi:glutaredoxin [Basidiobolus meristosporus CBS 931.73]|uniref:Glutaredoxin n=1 Tax=Basidiobolus meristosporus CBS 931.73 TaxID=1314790 RepID=A0A1Y1XQW7_9FUNG|nr:glutaredoxin [Basidiobolus meristosporus CBS 931.73]|eukprot:ORX88045.1 glutaredoxin [Basidiobolus meristosporus CBS 931.73]